MISGSLRGDSFRGGLKLVDLPLVQRKLSELEVYLGQLEEFRPLTVGQYKEDWKAQRIVERTLHLMIEICLDIANHIISDKRLRPPETYADAFVVLEEEGIISKELSQKMQKMARFRNIIVHHYEKIEPEIVVGILKKDLDDFLRFKEEILKGLITSP